MRKIVEHRKNFVRQYLHFTILFLLAFYSLISCEEKKERKVSAKKISGPKIDSSGKIIYDLAISQDPASKAKADKIEDLFERLYKGKQFNGAILAAEDGKIIYAGAKGYANFATKQELTVHSSFHLASVSKQFTSMAIMMLKEKGKLQYEDDVKKFLPDFPYEGITIRHLLNHTSGVPNILNYIPNFMTFWDSCEVAKNCDILYVFQKNKPNVQFKPGNRFSYNNTGYVILALIVEEISGEPFDQFIEKNIFKRLDMNDSKVYSMVIEPEIKNRVHGYEQYRSIYSLDEDDIRNGLMGEKGVYSSVIDLYKWDQALYTDLLVKQATLKEAFDYSTLNNGRKINYGFGWRKSKDEPQIVYHYGHWRGFKTCIIRFLDDKKLIVILNNTGSRRIKSLSHDLIKILYSDQNYVPKM